MTSSHRWVLSRCRTISPSYQRCYWSIKKDVIDLLAPILGSSQCTHLTSAPIIYDCNTSKLVELHLKSSHMQDNPLLTPSLEQESCTCPVTILPKGVSNSNLSMPLSLPNTKEVDYKGERQTRKALTNESEKDQNGCWTSIIQNLGLSMNYVFHNASSVKWQIIWSRPIKTRCSPLKSLIWSKLYKDMNQKTISSTLHDQYLSWLGQNQW